MVIRILGETWIIALIVFAIWFTMQEGEIFGALGRLFSKLPDKLHDPFFECPICMTFWYGSIIYWLIFRNTWQECLITVIAAMGLNVVILKLAPEKE